MKNKVVEYSSYLYFLLSRFFQQLHRYDYPDVNNGWLKYSKDPVFGDLLTGSVFDPYVLQMDDKFYMFVSERNNNSIIRIESRDGINWEDVKTVIGPKTGTWQSKVNRGCVLKSGGVWHMWYTGQTRYNSCIGHTTSIDGIHFENADSPCIIPTMSNEGVSVMNPCVLWDEETNLFKMWYAAGDNFEPDALFYAESLDGKSWKKQTEPVLTKNPCHKWELAKVGGCHILKRDKKYEMYYIGYQNPHVARICYAYSVDGIHWYRPDNNLLIGPTRKGFDLDATYKPTVVDNNGKLYMWYNGRSGNVEYIGLAIKQ